MIKNKIKNLEDYERTSKELDVVINFISNNSCFLIQRAQNQNKTKYMYT